LDRTKEYAISINNRLHSRLGAQPISLRILGIGGTVGQESTKISKSIIRTIPQTWDILFAVKNGITRLPTSITARGTNTDKGVEKRRQRSGKIDMKQHKFWRRNADQVAMQPNPVARCG
jgi:hypothetical protein